jgi:hypothetical protein
MTVQTKDEQAKDVSPEEAAKINAAAEEARAEAAVAGTAKSTRRKSVLGDLVDTDLVDQETGANAPLSATTKNLQGTVENSAGRAILKVAVRNYIGEEPVTLLAEDAGEFQDLIAALEKAATEQKKNFAKKSPK